MVMKERLPALRRWSSSFDHILGYARLSDVDAELEQLSMDPRRSPQRIGNAHLADKLAYLVPIARMQRRIRSLVGHARPEIDLRSFPLIDRASSVLEQRHVLIVAGNALVQDVDDD